MKTIIEKIDDILEGKKEDAGKKVPPKFVYDKIRKLRKAGKSDEEIAKELKFTLSTVQGIQ